MEAFVLDGGRFKGAKKRPFKTEREMQRVVEENITELLGLELVKSEYTVNRYRIDTVAFDKARKAFVIIEYKKSKNWQITDQGMTYLRLLKDRKSDFV